MKFTDEIGWLLVVGLISLGVAIFPAVEAQHIGCRITFALLGGIAFGGAISRATKEAHSNDPR